MRLCGYEWSSHLSGDVNGDLRPVITTVGRCCGSSFSQELLSALHSAPEAAGLVDAVQSQEEMVLNSSFGYEAGHDSQRLDRFKAFDAEGRCPSI